jgi:DNA-binding MarR family transcriptional regulator
VKELLSRINKVFENRVRLGVMSLLLVNDELDFNQLKEQLDLTDGNLASHAATLEKAGYLTVHKSFAGRKPVTNYRVTREGWVAFHEHLDALEELLNGGGRGNKKGE